MVSSISVFIFSSLILFVIGFLSGYFTLRFQYKHVNSTIATRELPRQNDQTQDEPVYEAIEHQNVKLEENAAYIAASLNDQQELEMEENLAYIPVQQGDEDRKLELRANIAYEPVHAK